MKPLLLRSEPLGFAEAEGLSALGRVINRVSSVLFQLSSLRQHTNGTVWIVGAGPGDPELLTVRALRLLRSADVVVHDDLVSDEILGLVARRTRRICVGKRAGRHSMPQDDINALLVTLARAHRHVVRLKGGDPAIFARTGEELVHLARCGIETKIVPGITAASGAAAAAGIPLTCRGLAQELCLVTAHGRTDEPPDLDWEHLAKPGATLALYMARRHLRRIARTLIEAGRAPDTPVMLIENATVRGERQLSTALAPIAAHGLESLGIADGPPLLVLVGAVVALAVPTTPEQTRLADHRRQFSVNALAKLTGKRQHALPLVDI